MKKILIWICIMVVVLGFCIVGAGIYRFNFTNDDIYLQNGGQINSKDGTYAIEGHTITLHNGISEVEVAPGSVSKSITRYFGNDVVGDFNGDGKNDTAFLLTQETGGSGTFFYVAALIDDEGKGSGTNAVFLGDRIAPQSTEFRNGMIIVNFAERALGEPFSVAPSVGVSMYLKVIDGVLQEVRPHISESDARTIAERSCIKGGEALSAGMYNEGTKTWWFDANLNATREGCNPACVVGEETKTAEINWRCTGLVQ